MHLESSERGYADVSGWSGVVLV